MSDMTEQERRAAIQAIVEAHAGLLLADKHQPPMQSDGHPQDTSPEWQCWYDTVFCPASDAWMDVANRAGALGYPSISLNPANLVPWCHSQLGQAAA